MAGRGRGGHYGSRNSIASSFSALGDPTIGPVLQPPPLYPPTDKKPAEIECDVEMEYLLLMDRVFLDHFNDLTNDFLENNENKEVDFLYSHMPSELQPKAKTKLVVVKTNMANADAELVRLERLEKKTNNEVKDDEETTNMDAEDVDEEMDEGTDYAHDYFDNGEMYEENDDGDNMPVY